MADARALELIQEERPLEFNNLIVAMGGTADLTGAHLRSYDLRKFNLSKANLTDAYMRSSDLRGLDLREAHLDGASLKEAKVSGTFFPPHYSAQEIMMSIQYGTRLRRDK